MSGWIWLAGALVAGVGGYLVGMPAWTSWQARRGRDRNAERYLAWRGRADRRPADDRPSDSERSRISIGVALGVVAVFCLVAFFSYR